MILTHHLVYHRRRQFFNKQTQTLVFRNHRNSGHANDWRMEIDLPLGRRDPSLQQRIYQVVETAKRLKTNPHVSSVLICCLFFFDPLSSSFDDNPDLCVHFFPPLSKQDCTRKKPITDTKVNPSCSPVVFRATKVQMVIFGQIVVGPPGSGKTTYCHGMQQYFKGCGRKAVIFNMDPANDTLPYTAAVDIRDLVNVSAVAREHKLGPNGSLLYAMEVLEKNIKWLLSHIAKHESSYILFDFPGQVELYTHNGCIRNIVQHLVVGKGHRLTAVNLVDSHYCTDPAKFIAVMLTSLTVMIQLELPAVNVLSKIDLIEQYGLLPMQNIEFFTDNDGSNLGLLVDVLLQQGVKTDPFLKKFASLNEGLVQIIQDFPFVGYHVLNIDDKDSVTRLLRVVDKSNGYMFGDLDATRVTYENLLQQQKEENFRPEKDHRYLFEVQQRYVNKRQRH